MTAPHRTALAALAASLFFSLGTAHADNRFGDGVGGAMGGTGSFGQGSVTIHHNLLPEEREEIDDEIDELKRMFGELSQENASLRDSLAATERKLRNEMANSKPSLTTTSMNRNNGRCPSGYTTILVTSPNCGGGVKDGCTGRYSGYCLQIR